MKGKLLLVDDNWAFVDSTRDVLEDEGYDVSTAFSGEEALELTKINAYDLVLMDIRMPGLNGVESFIRMKARHPNIRVILFTAYALHDLIQKARNAGVCAVLRKPLDMDDLLNVVKKFRTPYPAQPESGPSGLSDRNPS